MRWNDAAAGHLVGDLGAEVAPDHVEAEIHGRRRAGRRQYVAFIDVEHVTVNPHGRISSHHFLAVAPVGRRQPAVEQSGFGEHESPGAEGDDPGPTAVGPLQGIEHGRR